MSTEKDLREHVRRLWPGWIDGREPRGAGRAGWGSGNGAPDLQVAIGGRLFPIELKLAKIRREKFVFHNIRPEQRKWHGEANRSGVVTGVLGGVWVGLPDAPWWLFIGAMGSEVREVSEMTRLGERAGTFAADLRDWYLRELKSMKLPVGERAA